MLDFYEVCTMYYPEFYSKEDVAVFVQCNKITPEQYEQITGSVHKQPNL
ncbi:TPA: XkdX family protein [Bacillus cereus]|nr:XkdX family protein [Bacillus cereus]HDR4620462.1 XkdX family protein [Bacillus cereus]